MEVVDVVENCDDNIRYFDYGSSQSEGLRWDECDPQFFNFISFARYSDYTKSSTIRVHPTCIVEE